MAARRVAVVAGTWTGSTRRRREMEARPSWSCRVRSASRAVLQQKSKMSVRIAATSQAEHTLFSAVPTQPEPFFPQQLWRRRATLALCLAAVLDCGPPARGGAPLCASDLAIQCFARPLDGRCGPFAPAPAERLEAPPQAESAGAFCCLRSRDRWSRRPVITRISARTDEHGRVGDRFGCVHRGRRTLLGG